MVSTRSGRVVNAAAQANDAAVEVKAAPRARRGAKSAVKEASAEMLSFKGTEVPRSPMVAMEAMDDAIVGVEVFKVESAVKLSPRPPSQHTTPTTTPSSRGPEPTALGSTPAEIDPVRPRRLSMREVVQEAAEMPLPAVESPTAVPAAATVPIPRTTTQRTKYLLSFLLVTVTVTLVLTGSAGYVLCTSQFRHNVQASVQPYCGQAAALLQRAVAAHATVHTQIQAQWSRAQAEAQAQSRAAYATCMSLSQDLFLRTQAHARALAARTSAFSQQMRSLTAAQLDQLRALISKHTALNPPVVHQMLPVVIPASAFYSMVHQAPGLPMVDTIYALAHSGDKGVSVLLDCGDHCSHVLQELLAAVALPQHLLHVAGEDFSESGSAGALQLRLASFLKHSPHGVILISSIDAMSLDALSVMSNAMSEGGSLQLNGRSVSASKAFYVALFSAHEGVSAAVRRQVDAVESAAKAVLQQRVVSALSTDTHDAPSVALALRRRFDFVLPATAAVDAAVAVAASAAAQESHLVDVAESTEEAQPVDIVSGQQHQ